MLCLFPAGDVFEQAALAADDTSDPLVRWDSYEAFNNNDDSVADGRKLIAFYCIFFNTPFLSLPFGTKV